MRVRTTIVILLILAVLAGAALPALAAPPDGTLAIGVHVTLVYRRVRLAASHAIDRQAINKAEMLGLGKATGSFVPPEFDFALKVEPPAFDVRRAKQLLAEAGYRNGFDAGDLTPLPPYTTLGETVSGMLQLVGIRSRVRTMERATFMSSWREKKLRGLLIGATGAAGNAAARLEPFFTKTGIYAYGSLPQLDELFQSQAKEMDRTRREAQLHKIQQMVTEQVLAAPIFQQGFLCGVGPRVAESGLGLIQGFPLLGAGGGPPAQVKARPARGRGRTLAGGRVSLGHSHSRSPDGRGRVS
jgi:peptide/nickel transport system substrate-binding protein